MKVTRRIRVLGVAALLASVGVLSVVQRFGPTWRDDGALWTPSAAGLVIDRVIEGSPAAVAGLAKGDRLVAVESHRVTNAAEFETELRRSPKSVEYLVVRDGVERTLHVEPETFPRGDRRLFVYLSVMGFFCLGLGTIVALRRPGERLRLHFAALCGLFFLVYSVADSGRFDAVDWALLIVDTMAIALLPPTYLDFCLKLVKSEIGKKRRVAYGAAVLWTALQFVGYLGAGSWAFAERILDVVLRLTPVYFSAFFLAGFVVLWRASSKVRAGAERRRVRSLAIGTAAGIAPFLAFYAIPFAVGRANGALPELFGYVPLALLPLALAYAVIQNRIVDIGLLFRRMLVTLIAASAVFGACLLVLGLVGGSERSDATGILIAIALVALLFFPLRDRIQQAIDRLALKERYESRQALVRLSSELATELDRDRLSERLLEGVARALNVRRGALFANDGGKLALIRQFGMGPDPQWQDDLALRRAAETRASGAAISSEDSAYGRFAHYFPCVARGETVAVLALGDPTAEEPIDFEESDLVRSVCAVVATGYLNSRLYASLDEKAKELQRLTEYHASIVESLEAGVVVLDSDGRVERFNRAMEHLVSRSRDRVIGERLDDVLSPEAAEALAPVIRSAREADRSDLLYKVSLPLASGQTLTANVNSAPFDRGPNEPSGTILLFHDVTDRVALERQVQQTEKMVAVGLLAAGVAHEVNTPLTGISSYTQLLKQQMDPKDPRIELLDKIEKQTFRGAKIVNHLLNFSRSGGGDAEMLELPRVVEGVLALVEHQLEKAKVRVVRELNPVPSVLGSENKLQQVLFNLILNAKDAMPRGGWLTLRTRAEAGDVVVEVSDTGHGIPEENLARIFDPFFTTKGVGRGTGLGLAVSYGIVQEHHGSLRVTSAPGQGARFEVRLPMAAVASEARAL